MRLILVFILMLAATPAMAEVKPLETISKEQYVELTPELQAVYVAGIIDGMSAILYRKRVKGYETWLGCVRTKTIAEASEEVKTLLEKDPGYSEPLTWAVSKVIEDRGCIAKEEEPMEEVEEEAAPEEETGPDE